MELTQEFHDALKNFVDAFSTYNKKASTLSLIILKDFETAKKYEEMHDKVIDAIIACYSDEDKHSWNIYSTNKGKKKPELKDIRDKAESVVKKAQRMYEHIYSLCFEKEYTNYIEKRQTTKQVVSSEHVNYVYLVKTRESIRANENVFKLGKTKQHNTKRANSYPSGTILLFQCICDNCDVLERQLISSFSKKYVHRKDYGNEYFEGNSANMIQDIFYSIHNNVSDMYDLIETELCDENKSDDVSNEPNSLEISNDNSDDVTDDCNNENEQYEKTIYINTYEEYERYNSDFYRIVITSKNSKEGYLTFGIDKSWHNFIDPKTPNFDENQDEHLLGWLQHKSRTEMYDDNGHEVQLEYNWDKLLSDICKKCYDKSPPFYIRKYYEYFIYIGGQYCVLNLSTNAISNFNNISHIYYGHISTRPFHVLDNYDDTDVNVVNRLMKSYIPENKLYIFHQICYNALVGYPLLSESVVYCEYDKNAIPSNWLLDALRTLLGNNAILDAKDYFSNRTYYKKQFKTTMPRCIVVKDCTKNFKEITLLGVKNIITYQKNATPYNSNALIQCIKNERLIIEPILKKHGCDEYITDTNLHEKVIINDLFYRTGYLHLNFIKWCATKRDILNI